MIKINLLPHREAKRKLKKTAFMALLAASGVIGFAIVLVVGAYNATRISIQNERNRVIKLANVELDGKIKQIATLKQEIESLKARQQAVEDLQGDRNQPVFLMDELVKQTPTGVYLKSFKQDGQKVVLIGYAQSQERVAELLRNLASNSPWLERPDLGEVKSVALAQIKSGRKVVEFNLAATIKRPRDKEAAALAEKEAAAKAAKAARNGKPAPPAAGTAAAAPAAAKPAAAPAAPAAAPAGDTGKPK
jgi:type IV pilus assembly protein PilN